MSGPGEGVHSEDVETRREAVQQLATLHSLDHDTRGRLFVALGDEDWRVRRDALDVAFALADNAFVAPTLQGVNQADNIGFRNACIELARTIGQVFGVHALGLLESGQIEASPLLFDAIADSGIDEVLILKKHTFSEDENIVAAAISALSRSRLQEAQTHLTGLLQTPDPFVTMVALDGLSSMQAELSYDDLKRALHDRIAWRAAIPLLSATGDPRAIPWLIRGLQSVGELAFRSAHGLYELDIALGDRAVPDSLTEEARNQLCSMLGDDTRESSQALCLLVRCCDPGALPRLIRGFVYTDLSPRTIEALRDWGPKVAVELIGVTSPFRGEAIELAAELAKGDSQVEARLSDMLLHSLTELPESADAVIRAVAMIGSTQHLAPLRTVLDSTTGSASAVAYAFEELAKRDPDGVAETLKDVHLKPGLAAIAPLLVHNLGDQAHDELAIGLTSEDAALRAASAFALGSLQTPDAHRLLSLAQADDDALVRCAAVDGLGRLRSVEGTATGVAALLRTLKGDEPMLSVAAASALGETGERSAIPALTTVVNTAKDVSLIAAAALAVYALDPAAIDIDMLLQSDDPSRCLAGTYLLRDEDPRWTQLIHNPSTDVRLRAVDALSMCPDAREILQGRLELEVDSLVRDAIDVALILAD